MVSTTHVGPALLLLAAASVVYLRHFHPLANVPGPFLESLTELHRFYYNFVKSGTHSLQLERYREKYGPVIRIAPNEVLLNDPEHYETIYSANTKFYKDPTLYSTTGPDTSIFAMTHNEDHRLYRAVLNPFFSRRSVLGQEYIVQRKTDKLLARLDADSDRGKPTEIGMGFCAISVDVILECSFGAEACWNMLDREDFGVWYNDVIRSSASIMWLLRFASFLRPVMYGMPHWLARLVYPVSAGIMDAAKVITSYVKRVVSDIDAGLVPKRKTIFHTVMDPEVTSSGDFDKSIVTVPHMVDEAVVLIGAGAETVGNAMTVCTWRALLDPEIYKTLRAELVAAFPDPTQPVDFLTLEKLPYLSAVVKESLRLSYGVMHPLPRTVVNMCSFLMHRDPSLFPYSDKFDPQRWLNPDAQLVAGREKCLVPFSKGNRSCIGQPLAMCELYVVLGRRFRKSDDLVLVDVRPEDMLYQDYFGAMHPRGQVRGYARESWAWLEGAERQWEAEWKARPVSSLQVTRSAA
ncbi:cytochrome P450 [Cercophora newfieldiana]|uniref:Cytochrome P450 n=1 Tax=Cercophora newfieldiana TaxID=92897 RepID=A0AA40D2N9_9PEZI|nr:cytochrome P450 [Cercophora newfieldiana]